MEIGDDGGNMDDAGEYIESLSLTLDAAVCGGVENGLESATDGGSIGFFSKSVPLKISRGPAVVSRRSFSVTSFCNLAATSSSMALVHSGARARSVVLASLKRST